MYQELGIIDTSTYAYAFVLKIDGLDYVKDEIIDGIVALRIKILPTKLIKFAVLQFSNCRRIFFLYQERCI